MIIYSTGSEKSKFKFCTALSLKEKTYLLDVVDTAKFKFSFELINPEETLLLVAASDEDKRQWTYALNKALHSIRSANKGENEKMIGRRRSSKLETLSSLPENADPFQIAKLTEINGEISKRSQAGMELVMHHFNYFKELKHLEEAFVEPLDQMSAGVDVNFASTAHARRDTSRSAASASGSATPAHGHV